MDLVVVRFDDAVSVLYGRCLHRGALLADGYVKGDDLVCGLHHWDYRFETGVSAYDPDERLHEFSSEVDLTADAVWVDAAEVRAFRRKTPQAYDRRRYLGLHEDHHGTPEEPFNRRIRALAEHGLPGHHGEVSAMGVPLTELPRWDDLQLLTAQLWRRPLDDGAPVETELVLGPRPPAPSGSPSRSS